MVPMSFIELLSPIQFNVATCTVTAASQTNGPQRRAGGGAGDAHRGGRLKRGKMQKAKLLGHTKAPLGEQWLAHDCKAVRDVAVKHDGSERYQLKNGKEGYVG